MARSALLIERLPAELVVSGAMVAADTEFFARNGYAVLGRVLSDDDVQALLAEELRFRPRRGYGPRANQTLRVAVQLCHRSQAVRRLATQGPHIPAVVRLLGPDVGLTHVQFVTKLPDQQESGAAPPGDATHSDIPWHQDSGYGRLDPPDDLTVFFALTDMDEKCGCLYVVPGSHRSGLHEHETAGVNPVLRETKPRGDGVPVPLHAGEVLAFSGLLIHGSPANHGPAPRIAFYTRYCAPWVRMMSEGGRSILDDPHSWMVAGEARDEP